MVKLYSYFKTGNKIESNDLSFLKPRKRTLRMALITDILFRTPCMYEMEITYLIHIHSWTIPVSWQLI